MASSISPGPPGRALSQSRGALLAALLLAASVAGAGASPRDPLLVELHFGPRSVRVWPEPEALPPGRLPPYTRSFLALWENESFLREARHLASQAERSPVAIRLQVEDGGKRLYPGETLRVPIRKADGSLERSQVEVTPGQDLVSLARDSGWSVHQLILVNDDRFRIHPVTRHDLGAPEVRMGETGLAATHRGTRELSRSDLVAFATLHELAHCGDSRPCPRGLTDRYGPDLVHFDLEVLTPAAAFAEGWADYQAGHHLPRAAQRIRRLPRAGRLEVAGVWPHPGRYQWIPPWELRASDLLATQEGVARLLWDLEARLPEGRRVLEAAMQARLPGECAHLGTLLQALPRSPRALTALRQALGEQLGDLATPALVASLFAGRLPGNQSPITPPRSRSYRPGPPPPGSPRSWRRLWRRFPELDQPIDALGLPTRSQTPR